MRSSANSAALVPTVLAGCTGSTATSVRPAPAASGPGRSRAALDRMHERMAG